MKGPALGTLILTKDGKTYHEFGNIQFRYTSMKYAKSYDFYYPTEIEITAQRNHKFLFLRCTMDDDAAEYNNRFPGEKFFRAFVICESPGTIEGFFDDGKTKTPLDGFCKMEPQRQISILGHNRLALDVLLPPKGFGITLEATSHYFQKQVHAKLQILPKATWKLKSQRLKKSKKKK